MAARTSLLALAAAPALAVTDPWTTHGPWGGRTDAIVVLPDGSPLAGTSGGVFRSSDGAASWTDSSKGLGTRQTYALAVLSASDVLAGTNGGGLYRSSDGGTTWSSVASLSTGSVRSLALDNSSPSTWYASIGSTVHRTTDGGATWNPSGLGAFVSALATGSAGTVLAATSSGVFRSTDAGTTWALSSSGLANLDAGAIAASRVVPTTVFAGTQGGLFRSTDGGALWSPVAEIPEHVLAIAITGSKIWVQTENHMARSLDSGATWIIDPPVSGVVRLDIASVPSTSVVYAGDWLEGVWKSTDDGASWSLTPSGLAAADSSALAANQVPGTVFVVTPNDSKESTDGGLSWGLVGAYAYDIPVAPDGSFFVAGGNGSNFRVSADGQSWQALNTATIPYFFSAAFGAGGWPTVYGGSPLYGVVRTTDGGSTWSSPVNTFGGAYLNTLTASPTTSGHVWVGTNHGVFRSTDAGGTFAPATTGFPDASVMSFAWDAAGRLHALGADRGVYLSLDGGTWTLQSALTFCAGFQHLRAHPYWADTLFIAGSCGVFRSTDGGATWSPFGLAGRFVNRLAIGSNLTVLHAGLNGGGVWERSLVDPVSFYTLAPCRLVDTRDPDGPLAGPALSAGAIRTFALAGACGVPADARSLAVNVTVVNPSVDGDLRLFPGDEIAPLASTINFRAGQVRANNATLALSNDGTASLNVQADLASGSVDVLVDVVGFYR